MPRRSARVPVRRIVLSVIRRPSRLREVRRSSTVPRSVEGSTSRLLSSRNCGCLTADWPLAGDARGLRAVASPWLVPAGRRRYLTRSGIGGSAHSRLLGAARWTRRRAVATPTVDAHRQRARAQRTQVARAERACGIVLVEDPRAFVGIVVENVLRCGLCSYSRSGCPGFREIQRS